MDKPKLTQHDEPEPAPPHAASYLNCRGHLDGQPESEPAAEFALYSDAHLVGSHLDVGPYRLTNTLAYDPRHAPHARPALALHARIHHQVLHRLPDVAAGVSSSEGWTGVTHDDEIAALLSLALGIRCRSGGITRDFPRPDLPAPVGDPLWHLGRPVEYGHKPVGLQLPADGVLHVPHAQRRYDLTHADELLSRYPHLDADDATALLRAARAYQLGLWQAEADPEYAWLKFVSAIEAAAVRFGHEADDPANRLRAWKPDLAQRLDEAGGEPLVAYVGDALQHLTRATAKFRRFIREHPAPEPHPDRRPAQDSPQRLDWDNLDRPVMQVYDFRSKALHAGTPFPGPLLDPARSFAGPDVEAETPGANYGYGHYAWNADELPMYLHVFEHITRNALQAWWRSLPTS